MTFLVNTTNKTITIINDPKVAKELYSIESAKGYNIAVHGASSKASFIMNNPIYREYAFVVY